MKITPIRRALLGLAPLVALPVVLANGVADAAAPPTSPPPSAPEDTTVPPPDGAGDAAQPVDAQSVPEGYVALVDDTGLLTVTVPDTWTDVDTVPDTNDDGSPRPFIAAAPSISDFQGTFDVPGVVYAAFPYTAEPQPLIDEFGLTEGCESTEVQPYDDGAFTGLVQVGTSCGPTGEATWNMVAASPPDSSFTAVVQVQTATAADQEALDTVLRTFNVVPVGDVTGSSVPGSVPVGLPADNTPVAVAQAYVTAIQTNDAATACALIGPTLLADIAEDEGTCEEQFLAGNDADDPTVATMQVVGEATADSGVCEPASAEGTAVVEVVGDDAACLVLVEVDGRWVIDNFEEATVS